MRNWEDGQSVKICRDTDKKTQVFELRDYGMNDKVSSWYCGKNVAYDFCYASAQEYCDQSYGNRGAGNARSAYIDVELSMSIVYLSEYDPQE